MTLEIRRVGYGSKPKLNVLVYGMAGVGKTTFAAQAQDHQDLSPVLFADLEGGLLSVSSRQDIDAVPIRSSDELDELFWALRNGSGDFARYKTVVIDSGTNLANRVLEEWVARNQERDAKKNKNRKGQTLDDVQLEDYGKMTAHIRRLMTWYRDLDINLIVTALARFEFAQNADQRTADPTSVGPDFTAKLSGSVTGMMDHVWYFWADAEGRHMLTQEQGVYRAKTRGRNFAENLGFVVDDPNLADIYQLLIDSETSEFNIDDAQTEPGAGVAFDDDLNPLEYDEPDVDPDTGMENGVPYEDDQIVPAATEDVEPDADEQEGPADDAEAVQPVEVVTATGRKVKIRT